MPKITINIEKARLLHHQGKAQQLHGAVDSKLVKAAVYGANDGIVTTFAVVAGVAGAGLSPAIVLILGFANLIADGLSMGIGDYLGERSEQKFKRYQLAIEKWEIDNIPEEEAEELREFFARKGVNTKDTKQLVDTITKYPNLWLELGFLDEMGSTFEEDPNLWMTGVVTFLAFQVAGGLPLVPYILQALHVSLPIHNQFIFSAVATAVTMFFIGSLRTFVTKGRWWVNGLEMLGIGAIAAIGAYATGAIIQSITLHLK